MDVSKQFAVGRILFTGTANRQLGQDRLPLKIQTIRYAEWRGS